MKSPLQISIICSLLLVVTSVQNITEKASLEKDLSNHLRKLSSDKPDNPQSSKNENKKADSKMRLASRAERVGPTECPYFASLQVSGAHNCGGALITKSHVLTAAHCIEPLMQNSYTYRQLTIEVGSVIIGSGKTHRISRLSYHRNYEASNPHSSYIQPNDIAVITLATPITESEHVRTISLPQAGTQVPAGVQVRVSGFGNARINEPTSRILQKSDLTLVSHWECDSFYKTRLRKSILSNSQICANGDYGHGACQGDSGGPMVYNSQVVGLVSAGDGNCGSGSPDIYTKVSSFLTYIQSELNGGDASQAIAVDLGNNLGARGQLYPGISQYPTIQDQYYPGKYPTVQNEYYPQVEEYPGSQYPSVQYPQSQYPSIQYPQSQYPSIQYPQSQYPSIQYPQSQYPTIQYPSSQYPTIQYPSSQYPTIQHPSSQYPTVQYPTAELPIIQYPGSQYPSSQYPISQFPSNQYPQVQFPSGQYPVSQYPTGQFKSSQQAVSHVQLPNSQKITINHS